MTYACWVQYTQREEGQSERVGRTQAHKIVALPSRRIKPAVQVADDDGADGTGAILVSPGNRNPGFPRHTFKFRGEYEFNEAFSVGANLLLASSQFTRSDENNLDNGGTVAGYAVVNINARYEIIPGLELFTRINNVLNKNYANGGILGSNFFPGGPGAFDPANARSELFVGPGAPIAGFVGIRYTFGTAKKGFGLKPE